MVKQFLISTSQIIHWQTVVAFVHERVRAGAATRSGRPKQAVAEQSLRWGANVQSAGIIHPAAWNQPNPATASANRSSVTGTHQRPASVCIAPSPVGNASWTCPSRFFLSCSIASST